MENIIKFLDTPIPTLLIIGGFIFLLVSFVTFKKPIVLDVKDKDRRTLRIFGSFILLCGVVMSLFPTFIQPDDEVATPTTEPTSDSSDSTSQIVTPTRTLSIEPTEPEITATMETLSPTGLSDDCIDSEFWFPYEGSYLEGEQGCQLLSSLGIFGKNNGMQLIVKNAPSNKLNGIYRLVPDDVDIQFTVQIVKFTSGEVDPSVLGFLGFGVASSNRQALQNAPVGTTIYYRILNEGAQINTLIGNWGYKDVYKLPTDIVPGTTQKIKFSLRGDLLNVFIDGAKVADFVNIGTMG